MKRTLSAILLILLLSLVTRGQTATPGASLSPDFAKKVEAYMRELFAWGPSISVKIGVPKASPMPGLYEVNVEVAVEGQTNSGVVYASPDAKFIVRGEVHDTAIDPFASNRAKLNTANAPFLGLADAKISIVEFADFQCPSCKQLHEVLAQVLPKYPQVKLVYKDFPLIQIHPWAMTAALAGRCAYDHSPQAFWKVHDSFFDQQGLIGAADVWDKSIEFAVASGLEANSFKACISAPATRATVESSIAEGRALSIANTPTVFVNGRRLVGPDAVLLEQYIVYELAKLKPAPAPAKRP